jgi:hypothetical protein
LKQPQPTTNAKLAQGSFIFRLVVDKLVYQFQLHRLNIKRKRNINNERVINTFHFAEYPLDSSNTTLAGHANLEFNSLHHKANFIVPEALLCNVVIIISS